jgi:hypothetical protein
LDEILRIREICDGDYHVTLASCSYSILLCSITYGQFP